MQQRRQREGLPLVVVVGRHDDRIFAVAARLLQELRVAPQRLDLC